MIYNWQKPEWPNFTYSLENVEGLLFDYMSRTGQLEGYLEGLNRGEQLETVIQTIVDEAIKSSEIEGEYLEREDVKSSVRNNLGLNIPKNDVSDQRATGMAALLMDVRETFSEPLTQEKLFAWHASLMMGANDVLVGTWRTHKEPMQVISGALGKQKIHFEAPPSDSVPIEVKQFLQWFNDSSPSGKHPIKKPIIRSAIAHLYFESIHPFEDGNGRLGRCISEKALSQYLNRPILISLSRGIEADKKSYYFHLEKAQQSNDISEWMSYFVKTVLIAQWQTTQEVAFTLKKARFFDRFNEQLNERQLRVVQRMFEEGPKGFEGGMNARKYIGITKTSKATATRDLQDLVGKGVFIPTRGGRSTHYELVLDVK
ncbi:Fic family protein [Winogradskyella schleiferi]|uniref:Fic family protein n=1 Tax=Winogradskyella schleiferi TaxID=2686078 RepID=UPI0015BFFCCC|nr:Fic family protein [Winogradskyella schleiferi]